MVNPNSGERTIGMTTLSQTVDQTTVVEDAMAAPTRPPINACEDDEGSPKYHVVRFQTIAPESAANTTTKPCGDSALSEMVSLTVWATSWPRNAPSRFITAASRSATRGVSARVDTEVAMALAASWKPFV